MFGPCLHLAFFHHSLTFLCWPRVLDFTQSSDLCEVASCPLLLHISGHPRLKQLIFAHIYCDCCNNMSKHTTCYVGNRLPMISSGNSVPSSRIKQSKKKWSIQTFNMGPMDCPSTSVNKL